MQEGPNISIPASMMGDPARANMLMALMSGMYLTASELAAEAGVTLPTASVHLSKLETNGLIQSTKQGRHRYFKIADPDVAHAIEALVILASRAGHIRTRPGPKNDAMRLARSCYDHLAGKLAVKLFDLWIDGGVLFWEDDAVFLTEHGEEFLATRGIDIPVLKGKKRPLCRSCIDWSERKHHLGGSVGAAIMSGALKEGWARREKGGRIVVFNKGGEKQFLEWCKPK